MLTIVLVNGGSKCGYIILNAFSALLSFSQDIYLMAWRSGLAHTCEASWRFGNEAEGGSWLPFVPIMHWAWARCSARNLSWSSSQTLALLLLTIVKTVKLKPRVPNSLAQGSISQMRPRWNSDSSHSEFKFSACFLFFSPLQTFKKIEVKFTQHTINCLKYMIHCITTTPLYFKTFSSSQKNNSDTFNNHFSFLPAH